MGRTAARRALRRLNPVKVTTQKVPVVFEPRTARTLLDNIFEAVHGMSVYRHESFLAGKLGEKVASENVTVIDDGTIPGLFGTLALRRRGRALAAHRGDRPRRAEELPDEHLRRAQAGPEDHRQRLAGLGRQRRASATGTYTWKRASKRRSRSSRAFLTGST